MTETDQAKADWRVWLALNASTGALLAAILLVGMSSELWMPLMPAKLMSLETPLLIIAAIGSFKDFLDGVNFYLGGVIAGRLNTRRALLLFNAVSIIGLVLLFSLMQHWWAFVVALPLVCVWNAISGPAMLRVVGDTLAEHRRAMAFSLQSIQKRLSSLLAYFVTGGLVYWLGQGSGARAAVALALAFAVISFVVQYRYMRAAARDATTVHRRPLALLRRLNPQLKRLLMSEIVVRWCDSMPSQLVILYCVGLLTPHFQGSQVTAVAFYVSVLLNVREVTSLLLYVPIGHLASKGGVAAKRPFIGLTFAFFALFPIALVTIGKSSIVGLIAAFAIAGFREFGEPARKALVTELVPRDCKTQAIGMYWAARGLGTAPASMVGGIVWHLFGPEAMLWTAGAVGTVGAVMFWTKCRSEYPAAA